MNSITTGPGNHAENGLSGGAMSGGSVSFTGDLFPLPQSYADYPEHESFHDDYHYHNAATCPDCGQGMIKLGSCLSCPSCGYSSCGV